MPRNKLTTRGPDIYIYIYTHERGRRRTGDERVRRQFVTRAHAHAHAWYEIVNTRTLNHPIYTSNERRKSHRARGIGIYYNMQNTNSYDTIIYYVYTCGIRLQKPESLLSAKTVQFFGTPQHIISLLMHCKLPKGCQT